MNCNILIMEKIYRVIVHYVTLVKLTIFLVLEEGREGGSPEKKLVTRGGHATF